MSNPHSNPISHPGKAVRKEIFLLQVAQLVSRSQDLNPGSGSGACALGPWPLWSCSTFPPSLYLEAESGGYSGSLGGRQQGFLSRPQPSEPLPTGWWPTAVPGCCSPGSLGEMPTGFLALSPFPVLHMDLPHHVHIHTHSIFLQVSRGFD